MSRSLAERVVRWQILHGRNSLPWQNTRDPYRVWLSEVMLQQTQVVTVLDYYARFLQRFPDVQTLAAASLDEVLGLWSGLGYYSRARNLHACAVAVTQTYGGQFPETADALQTLPGIGRSTAAAIASLCYSQRVAILDGNVKRVLTRVLGFDADLASSGNERALWSRATELLPSNDLDRTMPRYTQGMMDLGATICLSKNPLCLRCPLTDLCVAAQRGEPENYPVKTRKLKRSALSLWMLWIQTPGGEVHLAKRPMPGVWAGLYCFALFESRSALEASVPLRLREKLLDAAVFTHVLTHKDLHLHPVRLTIPKPTDADLATLGGSWFTASQVPTLGLPAPVKKLLLLG